MAMESDDILRLRMMAQAMIDAKANPYAAPKKIPNTKDTRAADAMAKDMEREASMISAYDVVRRCGACNVKVSHIVKITGLSERRVRNILQENGLS